MTASANSQPAHGAPPNGRPNELAKAYDPSAIEEKWATYWVNEHLFDTPVDAVKAGANAFTMLLPPPNVTGRLHMGHMLNQTEMDILTRWHRMRGETALWVPGTDHAGIATQMMVEKQLAAEGKTTRQQLGPRGLHRPRLGMETAIRRRDHRSDATARRIRRLVPRVLHHGRRPLARRQRSLRPPVRAGPHLPRRLHRQLGPRHPDRRLRPRSRPRRAHRQALPPPLSARRRLPAPSSSPPPAPRRCWATSPWPSTQPICATRR